ncbi:hypothetical protein [Glycomyces dulcitolivorans]|uniref:hypothetical protein n=1 Tax=Glycomyces dulcitolivorans TaxID=2200759 RepID=UPI0013001F9B|nr:hypothetical protein [Glycomyces dulcitolivorans]
MAPVDRDDVERELGDRLATRDFVAARLLDCESRAAFGWIRLEAAAVPGGRCDAALLEWEGLWGLFRSWDARLKEIAALRDGKGRLGRGAAEDASFMLDGTVHDPGPGNELQHADVLAALEHRHAAVAALLDEIDAAFAEAAGTDPLAARLDALEASEQRLLARWAETRERISDPRVPKPGTVSGSLRERLGRIPALGETGWTETTEVRRRLAHAVEAAEHRAEAALEACNEPLHRRNRLRSEAQAYVARAERLGRDTEPKVRDAWQRARAILWTAPCSLAEAREAVDELAATVNGDRA